MNDAERLERDRRRALGYDDEARAEAEEMARYGRARDLFVTLVDNALDNDDVLHRSTVAFLTRLHEVTFALNTPNAQILVPDEVGEPVGLPFDYIVARLRGAERTPAPLDRPIRFSRQARALGVNNNSGVTFARQWFGQAMKAARMDDDHASAIYSLLDRVGSTKKIDVVLDVKVSDEGRAWVRMKDVVRGLRIRSGSDRVRDEGCRLD